MNRLFDYSFDGVFKKTYTFIIVLVVMMVIEKHRHCCYIVCIINVCLVYCMLFISWNCDTLPVDSQKPEAKKSANRGGLMDSASILDIIRWHQWNNLGACRDIKFFGGHIWRSSLKHRVVMDGHKALCFDKNVRPLPGNCLIYSFGINSDWSYDADLAEYGCEVHSFDPSIEEPPQIGRNKFYFHKIGVLEKIKQIAIETHNFSMEEKDRKRYIEKFRRILKLEKFGFIRFSSQPGMNTNLVNEMAKMSDFFCYEIAWYNPKFYK
ncbi:uncharacterized protein LOC136042325 isoform X3 [Artemia franciscana]|uniref:uncharacterized protein LOC136042325 isoform X3 n=1 Tax=Artemia franciscana TaxID=6661 RepID=UPI0032DB5802